MFKIRIITPNKSKESWLDSAIKEYQKRLKSRVQIEWVYVKNSAQLEDISKREKNYICLDVSGKSYDSPQFSKKIFELLESHASRLTILIGGDTGLSKTIKSNSSCMISLSTLTFTHQIVRLILVEQLYRAFEIERGSPYHK